MSKTKTSYFRTIGRQTVNLYKSKVKREYWKNRTCRNQLKKFKKNYDSKELEKIYEEKPVEQINETGFSGLLDTFVKNLNENLESSTSTYVNPIRHLLSEEFDIYNRPVIYAFTTPKVPNAIKIGFTRRFHERIDEWRQIYDDENNKIEVIGHWDAFFFMAGMPYFFRDESVHKVIEENRFFKRLADVDFAKDVYVSNEFFQKFNKNGEELNGVVINEVVDLIRTSIRGGKRDYRYYKFKEKDAEEKRPPIETFDPYPRQKEIKKAACDGFKRGVKKMLLAAVMRFGKTFTSLLIAKEIGAKITLVLTAKADVRGEWRRAIFHKLIIPNTVFIEILSEHKVRVSGDYYGEEKWMHDVDYDNNFISNLVASGHSVVIFSTLQDLAGDTNKTIEDFSEVDVREIKKKHTQLFNTHIDFLIVDETHYGARGATLGRSIGLGSDEADFYQDESKEENAQNNFVHELDTDCQLHLSGTPYRIMTTREFEKDGCEVIGVITYVDQLKAMKDWYMAEENQGKEEWKNPLYGLPLINMMGLKLTSKCREVLRAAKRRNPAFTYSISAVFECAEDGKFIHEAEIRELFNTIFNGLLDNSYNRNIFNHIVGVLPSVAACHAAERIIREVAGDEKYKIFVAVEGKSGKKMDSECKYAKTLDDALEAQEKLGKRTITLTCDRLMTGTTVRCWDTMLYLRGGDSPEFYDQARFRLTSSRVIEVYNDKGELSGKDCKKHDVFFIDFQPDRMLSIRAKAIKSETKEGIDLPERIEEERSLVPYWKVDTVTGKLEKYTYIEIMSAYARTDEASFADSVYEKKGLYNALINVPGSDEFISNLSPDGICDSKPMEISPMGEGEETEIDINNPKLKVRKPADKGTGNTKKETEEEKLNCIKNGIITILWFVLCTRNHIFKNGIDELFSYLSDRPKELERLNFVYGLSLNNIAWLKDSMTREMKDDFRKDCFNITLILNGKDVSWKDKVKFISHRCRKVSKNGVAVPEWVAKLQLQNIYTRLGNKDGLICEISSICGEYLTAAVEMYGPEVAKNFRILPMNDIMNDVIKRICGIIGVSEDIVLSDSIRDEETKMVDIKLFIDENKNEKIIKTLKEMKISAMVGNPPYQGVGKNQIYPRFYLTAKEIVSDVVSLIFPRNWQKPVGGNGLKCLNNKETKEDRQIVFIDNRDDVFINVSGAKETNIVLWKRGFDNGLDGKQNIYKEGVFSGIERLKYEKEEKTKDEVVRQMGDVVKASHGFKSIQSITSNRKPYGFATDVYKLDANELKVKYKLEPLYPERHHESDIKVFTDYDSAMYIPKAYNLKKGKESVYKYKVAYCKTWGNGELGSSYGKILILRPGEICTEKFMISGVFDTEEEAKNHAKLLITPFALSLLYLEKDGISTNKVWGYVPLQTYSEGWWNGTESDFSVYENNEIMYISHQLFVKYGVQEFEEYVNKSVKHKTIEDSILYYA